MGWYHLFTYYIYFRHDAVDARMEGVGDEVLLFGVATVVGGVMLYYAALHMFSLVSPPGSEGATTVSQVLCAVCC